MLCKTLTLAVVALFSVWSADAKDVTWSQRLNHMLGIAFEAPQSFMLQAGELYDYVSGEEALSFTPEVSYTFDNNDSTEQQCRSIADGVPFTEFEVLRDSQPGVCLFKGTFGFNFAVVLSGQSQVFSDYYDYLSIHAPLKYLEKIAESIRFVEYETVSPVQYLQGALEILRANYVYRNQVRWEDISRKALRQVDARSTLEEVHDVIEYVFDQIGVVGQHHGGIFAPEDWEILWQRGWESFGLILDESQDNGYPVVALVYPDSPAATAGVRAGDQIEKLNGDAYSQTAVPEGRWIRLGIRRAGQQSLIQIRVESDLSDHSLYNNGRRIGNRLGYLETFGYSSVGYSGYDFIDISQDAIRNIDRRPVCGWIVDARRNTGGVGIVMSLAIAPLRGEGIWYGYQNYDGEVMWMNYRDGFFPSYSSSFYQVDNPYAVENENPPIAVLVSGLTASMGELTAHILQSREQAATRVFGEPTYGIMNDSLLNYPLIDGASMYVVTNIIVDAEGQIIPDSIQPDELIETDYRRLGTDDDPLIHAAQKWLLDQVECN